MSVIWHSDGGFRKGRRIRKSRSFSDKERFGTNLNYLRTCLQKQKEGESYVSSFMSLQLILLCPHFTDEGIREGLQDGCISWSELRWLSGKVIDTAEPDTLSCPKSESRNLLECGPYMALVNFPEYRLFSKQPYAFCLESSPLTCPGVAGLQPW